MTFIIYSDDIYYVVAKVEMTNAFILRHQAHTHHSLVISMPKSKDSGLLVHSNVSQEILLLSLMQAAESLRIIPLGLSHR